MDVKKILGACDHTLLLQTSTWAEIQRICDDAVQYGCASVCIPPCFVKSAYDYLEGKMAITTVIGFPNGNNSSGAKIFETKDAVAHGADEIDMVINVGALKSGMDEYILHEISDVKMAASGRIVKVIVETCLLTQAEKIKACDLVTRAGADFIKTSTGFSTGGATFEDVALFKEHVGAGVQIKAAGGIGSLEDAEKFLELGATRLGTSRIVKIVKEKGIAV